jgi:hypothetical protein
MCIQPSRVFHFGNNWCIAWLRLHSVGFLSERGETDVVRYLRTGEQTFFVDHGDLHLSLLLF